MNQPEAAQSSTETPAARNVGSIPITRSPSQNATPAGKPGKNTVEYSKCPRAEWYAPFGKSLRAQGWTLRKSGPKWTTNSALIERVTPDHDTAWESKFVMPLASFMQKRGCQSVFVTVRDGQVGYEVTPVGESPLLYELVDATDEERYYPLGLFTNFATALRNASEHHPGRWEPVMDQLAFAEIRARKLGTSGGDYAVLWRGEWFYDYEATEWKLVEQQTGTLEKPLPITRA